MRVDVYKSLRASHRNREVFIFVREGYSTSLLPTEIQQEYSELQKRKTIDIKPGEKRIALNSDEAINNIEEKGYHIEATEIAVSINIQAGR